VLLRSTHVELVLNSHTFGRHFFHSQHIVTRGWHARENRLSARFENGLEGFDAIVGRLVEEIV